MIEIDLQFFIELQNYPRKERMLRAALWYAAHGLFILPAIKETKKYCLAEQYATNDPIIITKWYSKDFEEANISIGLQETEASVLDYDRHGEVDGFRSAGIDERDVTGLVCVTAHLGLHQYITDTIKFKHLPKGVEHKTTRVLVPPSIVDGVAYEWRSGGAPCALQSYLMRALLGLKSIHDVGKTNGANVPREKLLAQSIISKYEATPIAPIGYVQRLLQFMDPSCDYAEWSKIGMAMHHNDDSDVSKEAWREFSEQSPKYKEGEVDKKWTSFSQYHANPITLRWLILTALQNGCPNSPEDITYYGTSLSLDVKVEELNKKYVFRCLQSGVRICWLEKSSEGHMKLLQYSERDFKSMMQNQYIMIRDTVIPAADAWLHSPHRRDGEVGMWEVGKEPLNALNIYQGLAVEPVACMESEIQFFLDFTLNIMCRGNKQYQHYLLDLLAQKMQHPLDITGICLVLYGGEGSGKGSFCRMMECIFGRTHAIAISERKALLGDYNGGLISNSLWVTSNEAFWAGHHGEAERLKAIITEPNLDWNDKFTPRWVQRNCIQLTMTTNSPWAVPADQDSRRFFALMIANDKAKNDVYWDEFNALLGREANWEPTNPSYMGKVVYYLQHRKITSSFKSALETEWLIEQRAQTATDTQEAAFVSWVSLFKLENNGDVFTGRTGRMFHVVTRKGEYFILSAELYLDYQEYVTRQFHGRKAWTPARFKKALDALGMIQLRVRKTTLMVGQSKYQSRTDSLIHIAKLLTPDELEQALNTNYKLFSDDIEEADDD